MVRAIQLFHFSNAMETPLPPRTRRARSWRRPESLSVKSSPFITTSVTSHPFEYLDHTADIQLHAWGSTLEDAFRNVVMCMFHYITDIETVSIDPLQSIEVTVTGHDLESLLFAFMDEFLFRFAADGIVCKAIEFLHVNTQQFAIQAVGRGELFDVKKHPRGTEIKAITYSNMQIHHRPSRASVDRVYEVFVIVDI